jgi:hypothetical protein
MIPVHKLYHNFTTTDDYVFAFNAAYDTIQVMWKFTGTDASDTLAFAALEIDPTSTVAVPADPIQFVPDGTPIAGNSTQQIILFDWKAPALKITFNQVGAGTCQVFVKTFSYGLADANSPSQFVSAPEATNGMLANGKFGFAAGIGGNTLNTGQEVPAA